MKFDLNKFSMDESSDDKFLIDNDSFGIRDLLFILLSLLNVILIFNIMIDQGFSIVVPFTFLFFELIIYTLTISDYDKIKVDNCTIYIYSPYRIYRRRKIIQFKNIDSITLFAVPYRGIFFRIRMKNSHYEDVNFNCRPKTVMFKTWVKILIEKKIELLENNGRFKAPTKLDVNRFDLD